MEVLMPKPTVETKESSFSFPLYHWPLTQKRTARAEQGLAPESPVCKCFKANALKQTPSNFPAEDVSYIVFWENNWQYLLTLRYSNSYDITSGGRENLLSSLIMNYKACKHRLCTKIHEGYWGIWSSEVGGRHEHRAGWPTGALTPQRHC